ncbi:hypothetical protein [Ralstonia insidiosa]|jgi:hypothetical protein|nr:hypothetical protein [Ralstonia insidiosa]MBA9939333.1 hypothetical protein [Ralstonia insidiosa]MBC9968104.1 hypothetical protein [Ralstonia insidiosa]MBX3904333.1 hypothetical protein [Ralstonia insidiosa]
MKMFGVTLKKPSFNDITTTATVATLGLACLSFFWSALGTPVSRGIAIVAFAGMLWTGFVFDIGFSRKSGWRLVAMIAGGSLLILVAGLAVIALVA